MSLKCQLSHATSLFLPVFDCDFRRPAGWTSSVGKWLDLKLTRDPKNLPFRQTTIAITPFKSMPNGVSGVSGIFSHQKALFNQQTKFSSFHCFENCQSSATTTTATWKLTVGMPWNCYKISFKGRSYLLILWVCQMCCRICIKKETYWVMYYLW